MAVKHNVSGTSAELFDTQETPLPQAFDGELLYSWCARFHRLSGNSRANTTSRILFGDPTEGFRHDLPVRLDHYGQVTQHHLGTVAEVIHHRTQYTLHAPFLDERTRQLVIEAILDGDRAAVSRYLGLSRSGSAAIAPLKTCLVCLEVDRSEGVTGWWRAAHQWPTTYVCLEHQCHLKILARDEAGKTPRDWYLPSELRADQWENPALGRQQVDRLTQIARWTSGFLKRQDILLDPTLLRYAYLFQAKTQGLVAMDGSLRFATLRDAFVDTHRGLEALPSWQFLSAVNTVNGGFLGSLLRAYPGRRHPLKHVLLMAYLFQSPAEFYETYECCRATAAADGRRGLERQLTDKQIRLIEMVKVEGRSANASCQELGIPTTQGLKVLRKEGVAHHRRPRVSVELKVALEELLRTGTSREEIVKRLGIRTSWIKDYLATLPELRAHWEKAREAEQLARYREHFLKVLDDNPGVPMKRIRRISRNGFEWLYRNDREWLIEHLPEIWRRS